MAITAITVNGAEPSNIFPAMILERVIATFLSALLGFVILKVFGEEITN